VFFSAQAMKFFNHVPILDPIGCDLRQTLDFSYSWFVAKQTPYVGYNLYPPLHCVLFTPLLALDISVAYKAISLLSIFCFVFITFIFPIRISKEKSLTPLLMLIFITGLFSYGFQFELERGQFNLIAISFCFLAIWIYHYHNRYRYFAYALFTVSVQLKVFPFIFIVMLVSNWHDWKQNTKRLLLLSTINFSFLFVLGSGIFFDFIKAIKAQILYPFIWQGNHSIRSFVTLITPLTSKLGWAWTDQYSGLIQIFLFSLTGVCILLIILRTYLQNKSGINPYLFLACTLGALIIPSVSVDYKLSILAAPVAVFLSDIFCFLAPPKTRPHRYIFSILLLLIFSAAYSSTLFSYTYKPLLLRNNFPALLAMLLSITCFSFLSGGKTVRNEDKNGH